MFTYLKSQIFAYKEQRRVEKLLYTNSDFAKHDRQLLEQYKGQNPYKISSQFLRSRKALNVHAYGETPLTTMAQIVYECEIKTSDRVIEMGGGRGRVGLFLATYFGCHVTTYEQVPTFVEKGIKHDNHQMVLGDMFEADFTKADVIYLYGTMLEDEEIVRLTQKFPLNIKIITVSYPLADYDKSYHTVKTLTGVFPWGKTKVYWNERFVE